MRRFALQNFLLSLAAGSLISLGALAQNPAPGARVGILVIGSAPAKNPYTDAFREGLRQLGYVEGKNLRIEIRGADNEYDRLPAAAAELIRERVQLIFVNGPLLAQSVQKVNPRIPVVCYSCGDPVENGIAISLARPGRSVTGLASLSAELVHKRVELTREILPQATRIGVITFPTNPGTPPTLKALETASEKLHVDFARFDVRNMVDFEQAFRDAAAARVAALIVQDDPLVFNARARIAELGVFHRMPVIVGITPNVDAGAILGYSPERLGMARRAAFFADRILRGAKPGDLPFEQASQFELVVNNKTAKTIGLAIPRALLLRADRVID